MAKVDITSKAMLVNVSIGVWQGSKVDRKVSKEVTDLKKAERSSAVVMKFLIPRFALEEINSISTKARAYFYQKTLPWKDSGERILPREAFFEFAEEMGKLERQFTAAVDKFVNEVYPRIQDDAMIRLGDLYDVQNYPHPETVRSKFYLNLEIDGITSANDFRVSMSEEHAARVRASIETQLTNRLQETSKEMLRRLEQVVDHFANKMQEGETFKAATVDNLQKIIKDMKVYNLAEDPEIDRLALDMAGKLRGLSAERLRASPDDREKARAHANDILARIAKMKNSF